MLNSVEIEFQIFKKLASTEVEQGLQQSEHHMTT